MPILKLFLFFIWMVLVPFLVGLPWSAKDRFFSTKGRGHFHPLLAFVDGIFIVFALFEILTIPMVFLKCSLRQLSTLWAVLTLVLAACSAWRSVHLRQFRLSRRSATSPTHKGSDFPTGAAIPIDRAVLAGAAPAAHAVSTLPDTSDTYTNNDTQGSESAAGITCFALKLKHGFSRLKSRVSPLFLVVWLCIFLQAAYVTVNQHIDDDDAFYVATAVTAVETDTLMEYNPYTGELYKSIPTRYVLAAWPLYLAVLSNLCAGLHPTLIAHLLLPGLIVLFAYLIYALIARELFPCDVHRQDLFLLIVALVISFSGFSIYSSGVFLITRGWQGKALVAAVIQPALFYLCRRAMKQNTDWFLIFCAVTTACMFSSMGVVLSVIPVGVYALVYGISQKEWKIFPRALLACLGALVCGIIYLLL